MAKKKQEQTTTEDNNVGKVEFVPIVEEMEKSYLDYAMSVIVSRALPDVRDGLKPVHRRILYSMWEIGLRSNAKFRKSATVVGQVMAKYHPHGDAAIYDSLVRMAQDFNMRYPLVWGQGNFGSIDGDSAAAMRYTEVKLMPLAEEMLTDIEKDTVDFSPNYDATQKEPKVLPAKIPQLLINGTVGIAVGMATNIPPHNLVEVVDAICFLIDNPTALVDDLMKYITGPDFPTGGHIFDIDAIKEAYSTGRGRIVMRAVSEIVERRNKKGEYDIVITELPYQVNKAALLEKIAELVKNKKIEHIKDLRDESDREGMRIVIELKKGAYPKKILNQLYKYTQLQDTFNFNMVALVDGIKPQVLDLKSILFEFIKHRQTVIKRRSEYELQKAKERAHILEGLMLALNKIDAVIKTIKSAKDNDDAKAKLVKKFKLTELQAQAILEMKLRQLASLERLKIETELKEKRKYIKYLEGLLKSQKKMNEVIKEELQEIKEKYGDERRTKVFAQPVDKFSQEDLIPDENTIIIMTKDGYIKRLSPDTFKTQTRGGKGIIGLTTNEEDTVSHFISTTTHKDVLFFTNRGRVFQIKAYEIPVSSRTAKGQAIVNFLQLDPNEYPTSILTVSKNAAKEYLIMVTKEGTVKKVSFDQFKNVRRSGLIAIRLNNQDELKWVETVKKSDLVMIVSANGQAIMFDEKNIRSMGRQAAGVRGIRLKKGDFVVGMGVVSKNDVKNSTFLVISENGFGKMSKLKDYRIQSRGGSGIKTASITSKTGKLVAGFVINMEKILESKKGDLIIISQKGQVIRISLKSIPILGRATQGVRLMKFKISDDKVASVTIV